MRSRIEICLLLAIMFCCISCDNSEKLQMIAAENAAMLGDYLPYVHNDSLLFVNNEGERDVLLIDFDKIPEVYYINGTLNGYEISSDGKWYSWAKISFVYGSQGEFFYSLATGEGNEKEYNLLRRVRIKRYLHSEKRYEFCDVGTFAVGKSLPDSLRVMGNPTSDSPNGYVTLVRHKGLVEYSFNGQEIWRLVE